MRQSTLWRRSITKPCGWRLQGVPLASASPMRAIGSVDARTARAMIGDSTSWPAVRGAVVLRAALVVAPALFALSSVAGAAATQPQPGGYVWLEGENASRHTFNRHSWYSGDGVRMGVLSPGVPGPDGHDGDWLAHYSNHAQTAEAAYRFEIDEAGTYRLWLRASAYRVRMWRRLDDGPQVPLDTDSDPRERINLLESPRIDIRFLAWFDAGDVTLSPGSHELTLGLEHHPDLGADEVHGGIDALCLVSFPWWPSGALRPNVEPSPDPSPTEWFPYVPADDGFSPDSVTDLTHLLEAPAGRHGPVQRDGADLQFADGTPVRFWGVNALPLATPELMTEQARFLAKHGVNLVRMHPVESIVGLLRTDPDSGLRSLDPTRLEKLDRSFAILKDHGIYIAWSPFYPHVITPDDGYPSALYDELPDAGSGKSTAGYVNFVPQLQAAEWAWLSVLLDHQNPYTGLRYADDPALAILEIHNEDSILWHWPLNTLAVGDEAPLHTALLKRKWMEWLGGRYADDEALYAAWGPVGAGRRADDSLANPSMAIYGAWEMAEDGPQLDKAEKARMGDFIRFLAESQRDYFAVRGEQVLGAGFRGVRVTTAWQAGGAAADAANLWADDVLDAIDRHAYYGGGAGGHSISPGEVNGGSHLAAPGSGILSVGFQQVEDKPFIVSEWTQSPPNQWKAEIAPLVAFYGIGLNGWDAAMHFTVSSPRMQGGWPGERSYASETPHYMGQFAALATAVHEEHVLKSPLAAARRLPTDDLFTGVDPLTQPLAGSGFPGPEPSLSLSTPLDVLAMGRVTFKAGDGLAPSERLDWDAFRGEAPHVVHSTTGELAWLDGRYVEVRTARTQGVIGFAADERIALPDVAVDVRTPFVSLLFTSLDGREISTSSRVLVTALARDRQTGATYTDDGTELEDVGGPPLLLEPVQADIAFGGAPIRRVRVLDVNGVPTDREVPCDANSFVIDGRYAAFRYLIETDALDTWRIFLPRVESQRTAIDAVGAS